MKCVSKRPTPPTHLISFYSGKHQSKTDKQQLICIYYKKENVVLNTIYFLKKSKQNKTKNNTKQNKKNIIVHCLKAIDQIIALKIQKHTLHFVTKITLEKVFFPFFLISVLKISLHC